MVTATHFINHLMPGYAALLNISAKTAESHRTRLMQKLNIHTTAGLVRYAIRLCLVEP